MVCPQNYLPRSPVSADIYKKHLFIADYIWLELPQHTTILILTTIKQHYRTVRNRSEPYHLRAILKKANYKIFPTQQNRCSLSVRKNNIIKEIWNCL